MTWNWRKNVTPLLLLGMSTMFAADANGLGATASADAWFGTPGETTCPTKATYSATATADSADGQGTLSATGEWTIGLSSDNEQDNANFPPDYGAHVSDTTSEWININDGQQASASARAIARSLLNPNGQQDQQTDAIECVIINLP